MLYACVESLKEVVGLTGAEELAAVTTRQCFADLGAGESKISIGSLLSYFVPSNI